MFLNTKEKDLTLLLVAFEIHQELKLCFRVLAIVILLQSPIGNLHMYSTSCIFWFFCLPSNLLSQKSSANKDLWSSQ